MIKIIFKKFSTSLGKNIQNLNSLNKFLSSNYENSGPKELIEILNKFQELSLKDTNAKFKLYDVLDYIFFEPKNLIDKSLLKTVMRTMVSVNMGDYVYWDHFKGIILKNNMILNEKEDYLDYLKLFLKIIIGKGNLFLVF